MKVLMSCLSQSWGGMEMFVLTLMEQLLRRNFSCSLICYPNSKIFEEAKKLDIPIFTIEAKSYFHPFEVYKLSRYLKTNKFDILHTHYSKDLWSLVPALKLSKTKSPLILTKQMGSFIVKKDFLHKMLYDRVDLITAISTVIKNNLLETCPIDNERVAIIYNAVDTERFNPVGVDRTKIRNEFSISEEEIVIGMSARFTVGKGHEELLIAASELNKKYDNLKYLLVGGPSRGEDSYYNKIVDLADELRLKDKVVFTGFRSDMPEIYSAMDIFAFPSHSEAFGIALTEAMAMEKACVASNSDGILDIIEDGNNGLFFENGNVTSLKEKLEQLINSRSERDQYGNEARRTVIEKFELQKITDDFTKLYNQLSEKVN